MNEHSKRKLIERIVQAPLKETGDLLQRDGELTPGLGQISGVIALSQAFLCVLAVIAFHCPPDLTTPDLRHKYSVDVLRQVLRASLLVADTRRPLP